MGWLSGWDYRKLHDIEGSSAGVQTNYQIKIIVHKGTGTDSGEHVYCNNHCRDDFGDVRFTKSDGETLLDYWMEEYTSGDKATFWVKVPSIPASPDKATIYIYYGKSDATTTSNGEATFEFFDHFEGASLDTNKWTEVNTPDYSISNSELTLNNDQDGTADRIDSIDTFLYKALRTKANLASGWKYGFGLRNSDASDAVNTWADYATAQQSWRCNNEGTQTKSTLGTDYTGNYHIYEFRWPDNSKVDLYIDDSNIDTITTNIPDEALNVYFGEWGSDQAGTLKVDWVAIRKYVDPEPSHGSWGSEEQSGATEVAITDSATGVEALSGLYRSLNLTDIAISQESFSRPYRQLQIPEQASSNELLLKTRNLSLGDIAASLEIIQKARQIGAITDTAQSLEQILKQRFTSLLDAAAGGEIIARPTRMTILADEAVSQEILSKLRELTAVTDSAIGIEYVNIGTEGAVKTKIFLLIGDLAIQIIGD